MKPKPPIEVLAAGLADAGAFFAEGMAGFLKLPSLVPGRLLTLLARLKLDAGRGGGPIGLSAEKKLERRRSFGVEGTDCRLSIVRSDRDGRDVFLGFGVAKSSNSSSNTGSGCSSGEASPWEP